MESEGKGREGICGDGVLGSHCARLEEEGLGGEICLLVVGIIERCLMRICSIMPCIP